MDTILEMRGITKNYSVVRALDAVSFSVPQGSVFGILGPNGSGKTTLLGILLDVLKADSGQFQWFEGINNDAARSRIGALLETPNFYHYLSAWDNLEITANIKKQGHDDRERVLRETGLWDRKDSLFQTFSLGMKQRLAIAAALLGHPELIVLDEPTNGLDPVGIAEMRQLIKDLAAQGHTIIMASHMLDEVEKVCTHMAILKRGKLLVTGSVADILRKEAELEIGTENLPALAQLLQAMPGISALRTEGNILKMSLSQTGPTVTDISRFCAQNGVYPNHLVLKKQSLENRFIELTEQ